MSGLIHRHYSYFKFGSQSRVSLPTAACKTKRPTSRVICGKLT